MNTYLVKLSFLIWVPGGGHFPTAHSYFAGGGSKTFRIAVVCVSVCLLSSCVFDERTVRTISKADPYEVYKISNCAGRP